MAISTRLHTSENPSPTGGTIEPTDVVLDGVDQTSRKAIARAIGEELRRAREAHGWSRATLSKRMPSGYGERTIGAYENGGRQLSVRKLVEICVVLRVDPGAVVTRGLARARLYLETLTLHVDLNALLDDNGRGGTSGPMRQWAINTRNEHPGGIVEVEPAVVRNLALFIGCSHKALANHLARFTPEVEIHTDTTPTLRRRNAPRIVKTTRHYAGVDHRDRSASA